MTIENISQEDEFTTYKHLVDNHLYFLKQQSKCEFFYWKGLGAFFLLSMALFIFQDRGFILSPFIGIVFVGVGSLLMLAQNMRIDFEYGIKAGTCVEKGLSIEKRYDYPVKPFSIFEDNKLIMYRGNLLSRIFPTGLIALVTAIAGIILALKVGLWLAGATAIFSIAILLLASRLYVKTTRKIILGD